MWRPEGEAWGRNEGDEEKLASLGYDRNSQNDVIKLVNINTLKVKIKMGN